MTGNIRERKDESERRERQGMIQRLVLDKDRKEETEINVASGM